MLCPAVPAVHKPRLFACTHQTKITRECVSVLSVSVSQYPWRIFHLFVFLDGTLRVDLERVQTARARDTSHLEPLYKQNEKEMETGDKEEDKQTDKQTERERETTLRSRKIGLK